MKIKYSGKDVLDTSTVPAKPKFDAKELKRWCEEVMERYGLDHLEVTREP